MFNPQLAQAFSQARQQELRRAAERSRSVALVRPSRRSLIAQLRQVLNRAPRPAQPTTEMLPSHAGR
jgi:hypothetical protein